MVSVRIVGLPLDVLRSSREHHDSLMREFALIALDDERGDAAPTRLIALTDELRARFQAFTTRANETIDAAVARGDAVIDVEFEIPAVAADAAERLTELLDEADDFCRTGDLLTLATSPEVRAFRDWYLGEFVRQCRGEAPRAWADCSPADTP